MTNPVRPDDHDVTLDERIDDLGIGDVTVPGMQSLVADDRTATTITPVGDSGDHTDQLAIGSGPNFGDRSDTEIEKALAADDDEATQYDAIPAGRSIAPSIPGLPRSSSRAKPAGSDRETKQGAPSPDKSGIPSIPGLPRGGRK